MVLQSFLDSTIDSPQLFPYFSHVLQWLFRKFVFVVLNMVCFQRLQYQTNITMQGSKGSLFSEVFLAHPIKRVCINGTEFLYAVQAALHCGAVRCGDIVSLQTGEIGEVEHFWSNPDQTHIVVRLMIFRADPADPTCLDISMPTTKVVHAGEILDGVMWAKRSDNGIRVILPFRARFAEMLARNRA